VLESRSRASRSCAASVSIPLVRTSTSSQNGEPAALQGPQAALDPSTDQKRGSFAGDDRSAQPSFLRIADGAALLVGSAVFFYGLIASNEDFAAAVADFPPDADRDVIEQHIAMLLEAHLEKLEAVGMIQSLGCA
jgi:hypothetical protein